MAAGCVAVLLLATSCSKEHSASSGPASGSSSRPAAGPPPSSSALKPPTNSKLELNSKLTIPTGGSGGAICFLNNNNLYDTTVFLPDPAGINAVAGQGNAQRVWWIAELVRWGGSQWVKELFTDWWFTDVRGSGTIGGEPHWTDYQTGATVPSFLGAVTYPAGDWTITPVSHPAFYAWFYWLYYPPYTRPSSAWESHSDDWGGTANWCRIP